MNANDLKEQLLLLNNFKFGKFGEVIYEHYLKSLCIQFENVCLKGLQADFRVGEDLIDVKSKRNLGQSKERYNIIPISNKMKGIKYRMVVFNKSRIVLHDEDKKIFQTYPYNSLIVKLFDNLTKSSKKHPTVKAKKSNTWNNIKNEVEGFFENANISARAIHRNCQRRFGNEHPHNLKPSKKGEDVVVYVAYADTNLEIVDFIFAFPASDYYKFPNIPNPRLHKTKKDINHTDSKYFFKSLAELYDQFFLRFPCSAKS